MSLITLLIYLVVVGVVLYLINTYLPIAQPIKIIINVVVVIILCLWLLQVFGIADIPVGRVR